MPAARSRIVLIASTPTIEAAFATLLKFVQELGDEESRAMCERLGHANINTTNRYAKADLEMKRKALAQASPHGDFFTLPAQWHKDASIIDWLESL